MIDLNGYRALVGGATQGIGKAIAIELARTGAEVWIIGRNEDKLQKTINELRQYGKVGEYLVADYDLPASVASAIDKFFIHHPGKVFHILINNTGGPPPGQLLEAEVDQLIKAFNKHVISFHTITTRLVKGMITAGYGRVINIVSTSVYEPIPGLGVSNTIRSAVASWAKTLSIELAPFGVTVNNILPGYTRTERLTELAKYIAEDKGKTLDEVFKEWESNIPMGRLAEPREIAYAAVFLASPLASYITGVSLPVDGGRMKKI